MIQLTQGEYDKLLTAQHRLDKLREMCGHVEDGSDMPVTVGQDDATKDWFLRIGPAISPHSKRFYAGTFEGVIDKAINWLNGDPVD
ncbi:hypothetical protein AH2_00026 [Burkholderia phage vB_BceS_AH2]|uniref:Uncharacterized protein n=1 Tax=Burkholderia phage vB_BceS_AH2 TaxID=1133022 RepID=I6NSR6_9CAUD|nr:hypothetical protein B613_gp26 [Burkholderia phage vB_BceS_AH2]AEY69536.1 hypothetical protein AH2_00026 [Burkholderia phage vB_BceS_AH2]